MKNKKLLGSIYCLMAAFFWGLSFVFQSVGGEIGTFTFNGVRTLLGGIVLLPLAYLSLKKTTPDNNERKALTVSTLKFSVICAVFYTIASNLQQHALSYIESGKVGFITALYMILVPVFGLVLKNRPKFNVWIGVILGVIGMYFLSIKKGTFEIGRGEFLTLLCAVFFALHILTVDQCIDKVNGIALSSFQFIIAGIITCILMLVFETPSIVAMKTQIWSILYAGIMSCGVAYTCQILGQKYAEPAAASILFCLESVFSVIFGAIILHESLDKRSIVGCIIMFAGVILTQIEIPSKKKD